MLGEWLDSNNGLVHDSMFGWEPRTLLEITRMLLY